MEPRELADEEINPMKSRGFTRLLCRNRGLAPCLTHHGRKCEPAAKVAFDDGRKGSGEAMCKEGAAANAVARHLHDAIDRVREDMARVEFWAEAVTGFTEPVPDYEPKDVNIWVPPEQARRISPIKPAGPATPKREES